MALFVETRNKSIAFKKKGLIVIINERYISPMVTYSNMAWFHVPEVCLCQAKI
jgi:hypothetical protein